jgi:hypothetical protein
MISQSILSPTSRLGFHYFPDTVHFREIDLHTWLPELKSLGSAWITLVAPIERAIPEYFLRGLLEAGIEPILHFPVKMDEPNLYASLQLLFKNYSRWGVRFITLFDRPNSRAVWSPKSWTQSDLVERFLDIYLPLADLTLKSGLTPVLPPLEPGGDYWDVAFLRSALRGIRRRSRAKLLDTLILSAYAWTGNRSLNWGAGGPERWRTARPYLTPPGAEDQLGFRIFDWYLTIARAELGQPKQILLLKAGSIPGHQNDPDRPPVNLDSHAELSLQIARMMAGETITSRDGLLEPVPEDVICCNYWLLSADASSSVASQGWFHPIHGPIPAVETLRHWLASRSKINSQVDIQEASKKPGLGQTLSDLASLDPDSSHPIAHYLLLPVYEWGIHDWHLDIVRPFIEKNHPTVGFSIMEACLAARVTVVGGVQAFPEETLEILRSAGCQVERIIADGTVIAT